MVFLAGDRAYKLKRSVRYSYLDFSKVALREASCRAEVRLNRRTAPDLYLGVHSIARGDDGSVRFDGSGTVLDWVVAMRRFDQDLLFDRLAARGDLNDALVEAAERGDRQVPRRGRTDAGARRPGVDRERDCRER